MSGPSDLPTPDERPVQTAVARFHQRWSQVRQLTTSLLARLDAIAQRRSRHYRARAILKYDRAYSDEQDAESFAAAQLPAGEDVGVRCIWVMEVYLPSHFDTLLQRLDAMGVERRPWPTPSRSSLSSMRSARMRSMGGGWFNLGHLVPRARKKTSMLGVPADLPVGVDSVFLTAVSSIPGATVLVAQFRFNEETARSVEVPFHTPYRSTAVVHDEYIALPEGTHLRQEALDEVRAMLRRRCTRWMHNNLPGTYAEFGNEETPTCELLTFAKGDPLLGRSPPAHAPDRTIIPVGPPPEGDARAGGSWKEDYLAILGQRDEMDAWACVEIQGLVLRLPSGWKGTDENLVLSTRLADFKTGAAPAGTDETTPNNVTARTSYLSTTLAVFALARAVIDYQGRVALIRDKLGAVRVRFNRRTMAQLERVAHDLADVQRNARPLFRGILAVPEGAWRHDLYTFVALDDYRRSDEPLLAIVVEDLLERAKRGLEEEREVRDAVQALTGLVTAATNMRLQRVLAYLTLAAVVVAGLAIPDVRTVIVSLGARAAAIATALFR